MFTNQKQIRAAFWEQHPTLPRRRFHYSWRSNDKSAELIYPCDTRCAFVDFVDSLARSGKISQSLADKVTL